MPTGTAADTTLDEARDQSCYANQRVVEGASLAYNADNGSWPNDIAMLVPGYVPRVPECVSSGVYSLDVSGPEPVCSCSVHGHYSAGD
jgi:hypothetical protein